ncbi:MAG TPA: RNA-binding cell elongation regulator Jag/EloR [Acidimicrobiales bacterium]|nr:RNA-binding cell elongation regulator Jag/EloR [Acidimicrobiales bacterium]
MEWVETTGRTVDEAKEAALEELGVAEEDAEIRVLEEPRPGLFGRMRGEARVRARVRPAPVRPKEDRRDRKRRRHGSERSATTRERPDGTGGVATAEGAGDEEEGGAAPTGSVEEDGGNGGAPGSRSGRSRGRGGGRARSASAGGGAGQRGRAGSQGAGRAGSESDAGSDEGEWEEGVGEEDVPLEEQAAEASAFLSGLVDRMGLRADVSSQVLDEDNVEVRVDGEELGILVGPRGNTLSSLQELTRTVIQRRLGAHNGRLLVDVAGYRQKRKVALERFTREVAEQVKSTGQRRVLEPMSPPDRKVVHDTVNTIEGLSTTSEGEEPRRRVVIMPQG